jgi:putative endonuclease
VTDARRALGTRGERAVAQWYRGAGYDLLAANWRCSEGEIDLVLGRSKPVGVGVDVGVDVGLDVGVDKNSTEDVIVFCEVKTRTTSRFGTGFDAVTMTKQRRLRRLAARWLAEQRSAAPAPRRTRDVRFDVAAVTPGPDGALSVEVLEGAF